MANGSNGFPKGFFIGGGGQAGIGISTGAIIAGGLALITLAWLAMNRNGNGNGTGGKTNMDDETLAQSIEGDVMSYAASPTTIHQNRDRIRAVINRIRDQFKIARENYQKKMRDLILAKRKGIITQDQFRTQHKAALEEFRNAINKRHLDIMHELGIPKYDASLAAMVPTMS